MKIALLAIDIDGTLVVQDDHVPAAARQAVRRAIEHGLTVVLATGRRYRTTRLAIEQLDLPVPAVCLGGALTKGVGGATLHCESFAPQQIETLLKLARAQDQALVLQRDSHANGGPDFIADDSVPWNQYMSRYMAMSDQAGAVGSTTTTRYDDILMVRCFDETANAAVSWSTPAPAQSLFAAM